MFSRNKNISIRAIEPDDAQLIFRWENDKTSWVHSDNLLPYSLFQIEQFIIEGHDIYQNRQARFMVDFTEQDLSHTVGMVDLYDFHPHHRRAGIGVYIDSAYRNRGIAFTSLQLVINHSFDVIGLHQLYCSILPENQTSIRLFNRLGFSLSGQQKDWYFENGKYHDQILMQLINPKHQQS
jgi:diamine N-acetyltransferase